MKSINRGVVVWLVSLLFAVFLLSTCKENRTSSTSDTPKQTNKPSVSLKEGQDYIEVSYFKSDRMRAWSIYLPNPTEAVARAVADKYDAYNATFSKKRIGRACFFDSKEHTPIWINNTSITAEQERHQVAVFHHNPFTGDKSFVWLR
ncbi:MAG: hypothetical protein KAX39_00690 [candidate division Zixibacteria bacterium]|nr:hypothetical protein [candidate division Zixibacteria bacterium]